LKAMISTTTTRKPEICCSGWLDSTRNTPKLSAQQQSEREIKLTRWNWRVIYDYKAYKLKFDTLICFCSWDF
jgi:hypothetical protein